MEIMSFEFNGNTFNKGDKVKVIQRAAGDLKNPTREIVGKIVYLSEDKNVFEEKMTNIILDTKSDSPISLKFVEKIEAIIDWIESL